MSKQVIEKLIEEKEQQRKKERSGSRKDFYILGQIDLLKMLLKEV